MSLLGNANRVDNLSRLLDAAAQNIGRLLSGAHQDSLAAAGKAEQWLQVFGTLIAWINKENGVQDNIEATRRFVQMFSSELVSSLDLATNRKKITASLQPLISPLLSTWSRFPALHDALRAPIESLFFALPVLRQEDASAGYLLPLILYQPDIQAALKLDFIPHFFSLLVQALYHHRYALFPPSAASSSSTPADIIVSNKASQAILQLTRVVLEAIDKVTSDRADLEAQIKARAAVWKAVKAWGGYDEADQEWASLVRETAITTTRHLDSSAPQFEGCVFECIVALAQVDCTATGLTVPKPDAQAEDGQEEISLGLNILSHAVAADKASRDQATQLLLTVLNFHTLTHSLASFLSLLSDAIHQSVSSDQRGDASLVYQRRAMGPLTGQELRQALDRAVRDSLTGGITQDRGWGLMIKDLASRLSQSLKTLTDDSNVAAVETSVPAGKKRKTGRDTLVDSTITDNRSSQSDAIIRISLYSRLAQSLLNSAYDEARASRRLATAFVMSHLKPVLEELQQGDHRVTVHVSLRTVYEGACERLIRAVGQFSRDGPEDVVIMADASRTNDGESAFEQAS